MSARLLHAILTGGAVILSMITPVLAFVESGKTEWDVQELFKQCQRRGSRLDAIFCREFVSGVARQVFKNELTAEDLKDAPEMKMPIRSACPKSPVSDDAIVEVFESWANEHFEKWSVRARIGVMQAMRDTWPCFDDNPR